MVYHSETYDQCFIEDLIYQVCLLQYFISVVVVINSVWDIGM